MDKLLYVHRVAKLLDCSRPMVYKLIYEGKLKAIRIGKRGIRISQQSFEEFLEANVIKPDDFLQDENPNVDNVAVGDFIVVPLDSEEYNEIAGQRRVVTSVNEKGIYAEEEGVIGTDLFMPYGYFNKIKKGV